MDVIPEETWHCEECQNYQSRMHADHVTNSAQDWEVDTAAIVSRATAAEFENTDAANREYFVKWQDLSYRKCCWLTHLRIMSIAPVKVKNYIRREADAQDFDEVSLFLLFFSLFLITNY